MIQFFLPDFLSLLILEQSAISLLFTDIPMGFAYQNSSFLIPPPTNLEIPHYSHFSSTQKYHSSHVNRYKLHYLLTTMMRKQLIAYFSQLGKLRYFPSLNGPLTLYFMKCIFWIAWIYFGKASEICNSSFHVC